jgi:NAD(P)-dependent dehydrogenase (short-subunit alcohol dehydrogenase family)
MDRFDFQDRIAVVIGGSRGIGFASARKLLDSGASVLLTGRNEAHVQEAVTRLGGSSEILQGYTFDASNESSVRNFFEKIENEYSRIDFLINALGLAKPGGIEEFSLEDWNQIFAVNVTSVFLTTKFGLPLLRKSKAPKIVNVASIAGRFRSLLSGAPYSSSKGALITLTRQLGAELGPKGINVNVVCPGPTRTPMLQPFIDKNGEAEIAKNIPLGRVSSAEDQANVILFLCSELSRHINGAAVDVNGGQF